MFSSSRHETVTLQRACRAVAVPAGDEVNLPAGMDVVITQALGGSFTVYVDGNLFRIAGPDADAIGKPVPPRPEVPTDASREDVEALVRKQLKTCYDPEIPIDVLELGLIYNCSVDELGDGNYRVEVVMTLTAPGCGMGDIIVLDVREKLLQIPVVTEAQVDLTFDPPWNQSMMSEAARLQTGML